VDKRTGGMYKGALVPRNRTSVKVRLATENYFRELERHKGLDIQEATPTTTNFPLTHRHSASIKRNLRTERSHALLVAHWHMLVAESMNPLKNEDLSMLNINLQTVLRPSMHLTEQNLEVQIRNICGEK
jgi:hypothetical protein